MQKMPAQKLHGVPLPTPDLGTQINRVDQKQLIDFQNVRRPPAQTLPLIGGTAAGPAGSSWRKLKLAFTQEDAPVISQLSQMPSCVELNHDDRADGGCRRQAFHFGSAGVTAGGRRIFVDCSKSYAALNRIPSENGMPRSSNPSGRPSLENPPGTASAGKPRTGANWRLVPNVVCGSFVGA